ncbi:MAG: radical SAM protein [Saprospiraceae bacterium]
MLITPPFTQLNTPYPATMYLKGFLNTLGVSSYQIDLSLEIIVALFSKKMLHSIFTEVLSSNQIISDESKSIINRKEQYVDCIEPVMAFLQGKNLSLAHRITKENYLPKGPRFDRMEELSWAFGELGMLDKAKYLATLFIEDIGDFISREIDEDFGFSRYAERLGRTITDFSPLHQQIQEKKSVITTLIRDKVVEYFHLVSPDFVCITAPFPGNVFSAFYIAKVIKNLNPNCICILGGGYANTELRKLSDERVFEYFDHITLDDGEMPLQKIIEFYSGTNDRRNLKRTYSLKGKVVFYENDVELLDVPQREVGTPDYSDLKLDQYISVIEILNPMHRKWSDGRWNKLTLAHGCYWGKCSFCDVSLDYIGRYEPVDVTILCDRILQILEQTGESGFHFVDEAAPPALMKDLAIELIQRNITISWWTNIRFEKSFTKDLCRLLSASGCIAVTGGLEVASDRLLAKMKKGVTVAQVAQVARHFTDTNILVHAYLMYGFPTQTSQETVDSMEVVRQMIEVGIIQSGFWHLFAMTAHSPVGLNPEAFGVNRVGPEFFGFAENDCFHEDPSGADHQKFSEGLQHSLFNYMQGVGLDLPLQHWFDFKIPKPTIPKKYIQQSLNHILELPRQHNMMIWLCHSFLETRVIPQSDLSSFTFFSNNELKCLEGQNDIIQFLSNFLPTISPNRDNYRKITVEKFNILFKGSVNSMTSDEFYQSFLCYQLRNEGLLFV